VSNSHQHAPQRPTITRVYRMGNHSYRVELSCGHRLSKLKGDFQRLQWFIGRPVECEECSAAAKGKTA